MSDELVTDKERAISFVSQYRYCQIHAMYNHLIGNKEEAYKYYKRVLDCWDDYPYQKSEHMLTYISHINNYLNVCVELKKYEAFEKVLDKAKREVQPRNPHEEAVVFEQLYHLELFYNLNRADFDRLEDCISDIQPKLKKYSGRMDTSSALAFQMNMALVLFFLGKYEEAFEGFDVIIKQKLRTRIDSQCCAWMFKLAIAYEMQDENFDNLYRSAQRFFRKISKKETKEVYSLCLEYMYKLNNAAALDTKSTYVEFKIKLKELSLDNKQQAIGLDEMLIWVEHMTSNVSMIELLKEHYYVENKTETTQAVV